MRGTELEREGDRGKGREKHIGSKNIKGARDREITQRERERGREREREIERGGEKYTNMINKRDVKVEGEREDREGKRERERER